MSESYLFAKCPRGHSTPIRPSMPVSARADQIQTGTDDETLLVACMQCGLVYTAHSREAKPDPSIPSSLGLPGGVSLLLFSETIYCDDINCEFQAEVFSARRSDTTEKWQTEVQWTWQFAPGEKTKCQWNHDILVPSLPGRQ